MTSEGHSSGDSTTSFDSWSDRRFDDRFSRSERSPYKRDRDRILYSDGFKRLSGITQVARTGEAYPYHTRLTHSIKVSQVGRRAAEYINKENGLDDDEVGRVIPEVVAAAALAHDIGHPPFGHAAEDELDKVINQDIGADDGFEGNAQSFRIINKTETNALYRTFPDDKGKGLNLTKRTLNAILKYPWRRGEDIPDDIDIDSTEKFGYFQSEGDIFRDVRDNVRKYYKTPEAILMDWADDVTYAVHDLVDFYRVGMIPLGEILQDDSPEKDRFIREFEDEKGSEVVDAFDPEDYIEKLKHNVGVNDSKIQRAYSSTREADALIDLFQSELIEDLLRVPDTINYVQPSESEHGDGLGDIIIDPIRKAEVEFLKYMTFYYVIENESLKSQQQGERRAVLLMYETFMKAGDEDYDSKFVKLGKYPMKMIPRPFRKDLKNARSREERARVVVDTITSFTENQALSVYDRLSGHGPGSLTEEII